LVAYEGVSDLVKDPESVRDHQKAIGDQQQHADVAEVVAEHLQLLQLRVALLHGDHLSLSPHIIRLEAEKVLVLLRMQASIMPRHEEEVDSVHHPPELKLLEDYEDDHLDSWFVVHWSVVQNEQDADYVVGISEEAEEQIIDDPGLHGHATVWIF